MHFVIVHPGMITIPAASLAGAQLVSAGSNTNTTNTGQGTVTVTLPMAGNMVNAGGMVMVSTCGHFYRLPKVSSCYRDNLFRSHFLILLCVFVIESDGPRGWRVSSHHHAAHSSSWSRDAGGGTSLRQC